MVATIRPNGPGEAERSFRYAPLSSRLEIVRNVSFPRGVLEVFMAEPIGGGRGVDDRLRIDLSLRSTLTRRLVMPDDLSGAPTGVFCPLMSRSASTSWFTPS